MEFDMWAGGVAAGGFTHIVEECSKAFSKLAEQTLFDLIFKEDCFEDLTPTIYETQKARYKQTVKDLGLYHHYLEASLFKELSSSSTLPHNIEYLLEIRAITFGYHELHLQCLKYIDNMGDLRELPSAEIHHRNKIVFGAHLFSLKAKYELFVENIFKVYDHNEFDDKLVEEYIRVTSDIWSKIEEMEVELKDMFAQQIEPWKKILYATRHKILYPFYKDLYEVFPTVLSIHDVTEISDLIVLESEMADIDNSLKKWMLNIQRKSQILINICEEMEVKANGTQDLRSIKKLKMSEHEVCYIGGVKIKVDAIRNLCNKLRQVEFHTLSRLGNVIAKSRSS